MSDKKYRSAPTENGEVRIYPSYDGLHIQVLPDYLWIHHMTEQQFEKLVEEGRKVIAEGRARGSQTDKLCT